MTGTTLDPTRRHLVPVARLDLAHEPDAVHLAVHEWLPARATWLTGWAICGRSSTQGRLPDGTTITCTECLELQAGHEQALARATAACAAHGHAVAYDAGFCPDPCGTMHKRCTACGEPLDGCTHQDTAPGPCTARLDRDPEHWTCDRPTGHPGGHSAGEPWEAGYNAWTDRAAGASPDHAKPADTTAETEGGGHRCPYCGHATTGQAFSGGREWYCPGCEAIEEYPDQKPAPAPPAGALRDQLAEALRGYGFITRAEAVADAVLPVVEEHTARLRHERDLAIAHDRQPYPTAWAYDQACKALWEHRARAETAEQQLTAVRDLADDLRGITGARHIADALNNILNPKETTMTTCTATITGPHVPGLSGGPYHCARTAGHPDHHQAVNANGGRLVWTDHHAGATPHTDTTKEN